MSDNNKKTDGFDTISGIADLVNKAVSTGDYSSLNRSITDLLGSAADAVHDTVAGSVLGDNPFYRTEGAKTYRASSSNGYADAQARARHQQSYYDAKKTILGQGGVTGIILPMLRAFFGVIFTLFFGITLLACVITGEWALSFFMAALTAFCAWNAWKGTAKTGRIRRARKILKLMGKRDTVTIKEIAAALGKGRNQTVEDIRTMIRDGIFTGTAYMDEEGTAFMTSHEAYEQYLSTMAGYRQRKEEASEKKESVFKKSDLKEYTKMQEEADAIRKSEKQKADRLDKETRDIISEGKAFIAHIHQKNDEIPGEEFSRKLDRLEKVVTGIFERVEESPESAPDLHRLMRYYLPTTQKLVDTYATLDRQDIKGENIAAAKKEIEASLDTINDAFEKFLDSFFQSTAWDVSSDISVMGQMMAQDGLTGGKDFSPGKTDNSPAAEGAVSSGGYGAGAAAAEK